MKWIRIDVGIMDDSSIDALASALGVRVSEAVGCVVGVLAHLPADAPDGDISNKSDRLLEKWASWEGKRGAFASGFRATMCTAGGTVRAWDKHNGAALREVERQREKSRKYRGQSENVPGTVPGTEHGSYQPTRRDETRRDVTAETTGTKNADGDGVRAKDRAASSSAFGDISPCVSPAGHEALRSLLESVDDPASWVGVLRGCAAGLSMPQGVPASSDRMAVALQDFVAAGHHIGKPAKVKLFRAFVANAKSPPPNQRQPFDHDADKAEELRTIREQNERRRQRHEAPKPLPTWASEIDAKYPDGRTWPGGVAA